MLGQRRLIPSTSKLLAFEASARNGSFTLAAQELNLTQGAISRQVGALEDQLGVSLFKRVRKTIVLTDVGKTYADEIANALRSIRNASLNAVSDTKGQTLNLAILPTFGMRWLMPKFPDFLAKNPQITVNFASKLSPFDFNNEDLHCAIHFGHPDWPGTNGTYLMSEQAVPVAAPKFIGNHTIRQPQELAEMPLLHIETRPNAWADWFKQNHITPPKDRGMVLEQFTMVTQAAVAGLGVAILPYFLISTELERGELEILMETPLENSAGYYLVTPKTHENYAPVVAFKEWLLEQTNN